jgi:hypothetical protein
MKIRPVVVEFYTDRRTDMINLIVFFAILQTQMKNGEWILST